MAEEVTVWGTSYRTNIHYERQATLAELKKQVPHFVDMGYPYEGATFQIHHDIRGRLGISRNKYWRGQCVECGDVHIVRADKITTKRCRHTGTKHI